MEVGRSGRRACCAGRSGPAAAPALPQPASQLASQLDALRPASPAPSVLSRVALAYRESRERAERASVAGVWEGGCLPACGKDSARAQGKGRLAASPPDPARCSLAPPPLPPPPGTQAEARLAVLESDSAAERQRQGAHAAELADEVARLRAELTAALSMGGGARVDVLSVVMGPGQGGPGRAGPGGPGGAGRGRAGAGAC